MIIFHPKAKVGLVVSKSRRKLFVAQVLPSIKRKKKKVDFRFGLPEQLSVKILLNLSHKKRTIAHKLHCIYCNRVF